MYNSQYYTCEQIDQRLLQGYLDDYNSQNDTHLTKAEFLTLLFNTVSRNNTVDNLVTQIGYYECDTAAGTAAKAITVANYSLFAGGSMKVKFVNKNTANNATLNINSQGAKALYYQGERASSTNSWDEGEVVEIYYDGTSYYANNVKGGSGSGVYDVSVEHPNSGPNGDGKFTLEYILNPSNVNELIPANKRYPGMSIQFVSTYNNKYVQYHLRTTNWSANVSDWQGVDIKLTGGSHNTVESRGIVDVIVLKIQGTPNASSQTVWDLDYLLIKGKTYKVKKLSGDGSAIIAYNQSISLKQDEWVTFTANFTPDSTKPYISVTTRNEAPVLLFATEDTASLDDTLAEINKSKSYTDNNLNPTQATGVAGSASFIFSSYPFKKDTTYLIKLISGPEGSIATSTSDSVKLSKKNYVEFTPLTNTTPYIYIGSTIDPATPPVINIILKNDIAKRLGDAEFNINNLFNAIKTERVTATDGTSSFRFDTVYEFEVNKTYLIKGISGYLGTLNAPNTEGAVITIDKFVEFTPKVKSPIYIYANPTTGKEAPVIDIVIKDTIEGQVVLLADELKSVEKQLDKSSVTGVENASQTSFLFNSYPFVKNTTYLIKHISGFLGGFATIPADNVRLINGQWVEFTPQSNSNVYSYVGSSGSTVGEEAPVVDIVVKNTVEGQVSILEQGVQEINKQFDKQQVTGVANQAGTVFIYDYPFKVNVVYMIKHISGYVGNIASAPGDATYLVNGQWIEFKPISLNSVYTYVGTTEGKEAPIIEVVVKDTVEGQIAEVDAKVGDAQKIVKWTQINVSRDGTSKHGLTIQYSGLTAIADAINSITDASEYNRYRIHVEGVFEFTDPMTVPMEGGGEYSIIYMKDWVDIEGDGPDNSVLIMDFPAGLDNDQSKPIHFHEGKAYNDYQPIYFRRGQRVSGLKVVAKNTRYAFHIEQDGAPTFDKTIEIENCEVEFRGHLDYDPIWWGNCFGTGITSGQVWNIKNCTIKGGEGAALGVHTPLGFFARPATINFENCVIEGRLTLSNYQEGNNVVINIINCTAYDGCTMINSQYWNNNVNAKGGDYNTVFINGNTFKALYTKSLLYGKVLRVTSNSTGVSSVVRFGKYSSAFNVIIGNSDETIQVKTKYEWDTQYGYVFRDGGVDLSGQAFGTIDVDESSSLHTSLASLLGDCSSINKVLVISVDGTDYTVTFNEDYTSKDNAYVLAAINAVIGSVATADLFCPASLYYPKVNGMKLIKSVDTGAILKGMGIVFVSGGMRRAKATDGYIDGICLDNTSNGQYGRVITCGYIYSQSQLSSVNLFTTYDTMSGLPSANIGKTLGINPDNDGQFKQDNSLVPLLRCKSDCLEIL